MIVALAIAVPGIVLLIALVVAGVVAGPGRRSDQVLVAPRGARYSDATRILRAAARAQERQRAQGTIPRQRDAEKSDAPGAALSRKG